MKESAESLLQSIIDQKPLETQQIFDALVVDKLNTMLGDYKTGLAQDKFNGGEEEKSEVEVDLSDEEIEELLSNLSDEDLQQMISDMEDENGSEDQEAEFEDEEPEEIDTPEIEESKASVRSDLAKKMEEYKAKGGKITVGKTSKKKVAGGLREDAEELDEISKKTLRSYLKKRHPYKAGDYKKEPHPNAVRAGDRLDNQYVSKIDKSGKKYLRDYDARKRMTPDENVFKSGKSKKKIEESEKLDETVTRKHFKLAADTIKSLPEDKRKEHAELHANMYAKENPRFNRAKFMEACGVKN